jgi:lipoyl(octanoyl) transferase
MLDDALIPPPFFKSDDSPAPEWIVADGLVSYPDAVTFMEARASAIADSQARECIWLVEHPPLYTAGVSAKGSDLIAPERFPVFATARGGQYTYHGPGQRVVYVMLDLNRRKKDVRLFVEALEQWVIDTLWRFNVEGHIRPGRVGVWVERKDKGYSPPIPGSSEPGKADRPTELARGAAPNLPVANSDFTQKPSAPLARSGAFEQRYKEDKIAAIGIKLRRWVSFHGISLNVEPDLSHFSGIVPCGITEHGVTSLLDLGLPITMDEVDYALRMSFEAIFGPVDA